MSRRAIALDPLQSEHAGTAGLPLCIEWNGGKCPGQVWLLVSLYTDEKNTCADDVSTVVHVSKEAALTSWLKSEVEDFEENRIEWPEGWDAEALASWFWTTLVQYNSLRDDGGFWIDGESVSLRAAPLWEQA